MAIKKIKIGSTEHELQTTIANVDNLQASLNAKQATVTGAATTITGSNLTASRALISNSSGKVAVSDVTSTELGYLDGVTSNVQTQLNGKAASSHTHSYAGSSSAGGAATSANKLNTNAGDSNTPVYFSNGVPVACTSLDLSTTGNADTATKATNDSDGNKISDTYLKKSGGTVTGGLKVNNGLTAGGSTTSGLTIVDNNGVQARDSSLNVSDLYLNPFGGKVWIGYNAYVEADGGVCAAGFTGTLSGNASSASTAGTATTARVSESDKGFSTSGSGSAYTASVTGITALSTGVSFTMIPHTVSTTTQPTLNVNSLGAKYIRRRLSTKTGTTVVGSSTDWLTASKPVRVTYDGTYWIVDYDRPSASDIYGSVPIANGGTGATTAAAARTNLGAMANVSVTSSDAGKVLMVNSSGAWAASTISSGTKYEHVYHFTDNYYCDGFCLSWTDGYSTYGTTPETIISNIISRLAGKCIVATGYSNYQGGPMCYASVSSSGVQLCATTGSGGNSGCGFYTGGDDSSDHLTLNAYSDRAI